MNQTGDRALFHKRQCSRRLALQAMYQWHLTDEKPDVLVNQYQEDEYWPKSDHEYFSELVIGSIKQADIIDENINNASEYNVENIDPIELAALRIATYELINCIQIPEKVITSEAIRLCKKFGSDEGFKLVNVVLDKLMKKFDRKLMLQQS
ncbi:MAG: transcription antitermination factor NusB [Gammaproteobacteria bacterium]|nr:transcription antitermination factor NusB [Gammaproteobacteria bacterium]